MSQSKYADIIDLDRPISKNHAPMSMENRAAQFMPFAALTGYDDAVEETARYTGEKKMLTPEKKAELQEKLSEIIGKDNRGIVRVTYFVPDRLKDGGEYITLDTRLVKVDEFRKRLVFSGGVEISTDDIIYIGEIAQEVET